MSDDGKCKVVCRDQEKIEYVVSVNDGVLSVSVKDQRKWYEHITIMSFESAKITVYLPKTEYGKLSVKGSTCDIMIPADFSFDDVKIETSTGDVEELASATNNI